MPETTHQYPPIAVLRHGETEWNVSGRMQGHLDSPLTALGLQQAQAQRRLLAEFITDDWAIRSSPQGRALHTAAIACSGLAQWIRTDDRLAEIDLGAWSGDHKDTIKSRVRAAQGALPGPLDHYAHTPGENFIDLQVRCKAVLDDLSTPTVLVTHGITSRMIRLIAQGLPLEMIAELPGGQGNIHVVEAGTHRTLGPAVDRFETTL